MILPLGIAIKDFLGIYALTPFEQRLLKALAEELTSEERHILKSQLSKFNAVRRLVKHINKPGAHGFTNFHTLRFGKSISKLKHDKRFLHAGSEHMLARAKVLFTGGVIDVQFWLVNGIFFRIEYRSPQRIYYPPGDYVIEDMQVTLGTDS